MDCVFWQDECEITYGGCLKKSNHEDAMNMIFKECEDKDGCIPEGSFSEISIPMKNFKDQ